jgi:hypothetical protein
VARARSIALVDFQPDDLAAVLAEMNEIGRARNGWVNVRPVPLDDPADERLTEFAPTPPVAPVGLFARWRLVLIEGTWLPGKLGRNGAEDASVGLSHPAGRFAVRQLRDAGVPLPDGWRVIVDHAKRGMVITIPDGPGGATDATATVLDWFLAAGRVLGPDQVTGRWRAEVHRR